MTSQIATALNRTADHLVAILPAYADVMLHHDDGSRSVTYQIDEVDAVLQSRRDAAAEHGDDGLVTTLDAAMMGEQHALSVALEIIAEEVA